MRVPVRLDWVEPYPIPPQPLQADLDQTFLLSRFLLSPLSVVFISATNGMACLCLSCGCVCMLSCTYVFPWVFDSLREVDGMDGSASNVWVGGLTAVRDTPASIHPSTLSAVSPFSHQQTLLFYSILSSFHLPST